MRGTVESGNLYTPEILPVIAGGVTPPYNVFPFSGVYRDMSGLLSDSNTNFANNVQDAASGMMTGLVYNDPQTLASDVLFYGRQIEAARQLERQQASETLREHETKQPKRELKQNNKDSASLVPDKQVAEKETLSLSPIVSDTVKALGKSLGSFIKSEFTVSLPTATLGTHTPAYPLSSSGMAYSNMALAA